MPVEKTKAVLEEGARSMIRYVALVADGPVKPTRVVEVGDGMVMCITVCPAGSLYPTADDQAAPSPLDPSGEAIVEAVRLFRAVPSNRARKFGPSAIKKAMEAAAGEAVGMSTVWHQLRRLVELGLVEKVGKFGYYLGAKAGKKLPRKLPQQQGRIESA